MLYTGQDVIEEHDLKSRLIATRDFSPANALSFMVFILLYCPCIATITAIARETGSWKYGAFSVIYNTAVAWLAAFLVYRIALLF